MGKLISDLDDARLDGALLDLKDFLRMHKRRLKGHQIIGFPFSKIYFLNKGDRES